MPDFGMIVAAAGSVGLATGRRLLTAAAEGLLLVAICRSDDYVVAVCMHHAGISPIRTRILSSRPAISTTRPLAVADATVMDPMIHSS